MDFIRKLLLTIFVMLIVILTVFLQDVGKSLKYSIAAKADTWKITKFKHLTIQFHQGIP